MFVCQREPYYVFPIFFTFLELILSWFQHLLQCNVWQIISLSTVLPNLLQLEWMPARRRKMTVVGAAYNVFALGEGTSDLESREKLWFGHLPSPPLQSVTFKVFHWFVVEVVWVWFGRGVILRVVGDTGWLASLNQTHHILHLLSTVAFHFYHNWFPAMANVWWII